MPEAITKYAINSTLGTEDFKPLDEIITGGKSLITSDNLYYQIYVGDLFVMGNDDIKQIQIPKKIKFNYNGAINLKYYLFNSTDWQYAILEIYKNNQLYQSLTGTEEEILLTTTVTVNKKDEFYFILKNTSEAGTNKSYLKDLFIYADVIDTSGITAENI